MRRRGWALLVGCALGLPLAAVVGPTAPAIAQTQTQGQSALRVRAGTHPGYSRVVFDWPRLVDYQVSENGSSVTLRFATAADVNVAQLRGRLPRGIGLTSATSQDGATTVVLTLPAGSPVRHFRDGSNIVLDVMDPPKTATTPPPAAAAAPPAATAAARPPTAATPAQTSPAPTTPAAPAASAAAPAQATPAQAATAPAVQAAAPGAPKPVTPPAKGPAQPAGKAAAPAAPPPAAAAEPPPPSAGTAPALFGPAGGAPAASAPPPAPAQPPAPAAAGAKPGAAPPAPTSPPGAPAVTPAPQTSVATAAPTTAATAAPNPAAAAAAAAMANLPTVQMRLGGGDKPRIEFPWSEATLVAAFPRNGSYWLVFNKPAMLDLSAAVTSGGLITAADQVPNEKGAVAKLTIAPEWAPTVTREGNVWTMTMEKAVAPPPPPTPLEVKRGEVAGGETVFLPVPEPGQAQLIADPEAGDTFYAVPVGPGRGVTDQREFVQFLLMPTQQGVVVQPRADGVTVDSTRETVEISALSGLMLSRGQVTVSGALLRFGDWRRGGERQYLDNKQALQYALGMARPDARNAARLDLARFYLAWGMEAEALGLLRRMQETDPSIERDRNFRALRGIARLGMSRLEEAAIDLNHVSLTQDPDMALWRGLLQVEQHDYKAARRSFVDGRDAMQYYPQDIQSRFHIGAADALFHTDDAQSAKEEMELVEDKLLDRTTLGQADLLRYRIFRALNEDRVAAEYLQRAEQSGNRLVRVQAELDVIERDLETKKISVKDAINRLDRLRFAWRGDDFEVKLLRRLGELRIEDGDYRGGLAALKQVATNFPRSREGQEAARRMSEVFSNLFMDGGADKLPPVQALGLFYDFRELTPTGARGDEMIRKLADRLAQVDLLGRAAELLDHQVRFRLRGEEKAKVAVRLAVIQLLDRKAEDALKTLRDTQTPGIPVALQRERRYLEVRALGDLGRFDEALGLLGGDQSREANVLRADIYWRQKDWRQAARALLATLDQTAKESDKQLDGTERRRVLEAAVALALANDRPALEQMRDQWTKRLAGSAEADAFQVVTTPVEATDVDGIRQRAGAIAQIGQLESFMANYRERLSKGGISAIN